ncbi:4-hydroxy-3-methylbut-2-enyl diphosphate reductase [Candidatus Woesearchaeota archaeon]|nr:4-hydroxy-3-methylbut-2-enyl diphosphate reductase [Candidatus Woesearchaeota archaeon]
MEIMVAKHAGFCFGVKRAIDIAEEVASKNRGKTYVYGQLVHNERVIEDLEKKGIEFVDKIEEIPENAVTVLRAHGEPGATYQQLKEKNINKNDKLNDATCPLVTLVHNVAIKLKNNGYEVILFGKKDHPEAVGTSYHIKGNGTLVIESPDNANELVYYIKKNDFKKVAIISQTTMSVNGYKELIENINNLSDKKFEELHLSLRNMSKPYVFVDTICNPTKQRQLGTEEIAKKADIMIVIGGKNSSNSKELAAKSRSYGVKTHFIQEAKQLEEEWLKGKEKIGVSAGASTPDITIKEVVERIKEIASLEEKGKPLNTGILG